MTHTSTEQPEALRLADKYEAEGFLQDHRFAQDHWCRQAAAELRRQHARIAELEAQLSAIGAGGVEQLRKQVATPQAVHPENIREGAPYDNPEFEQLARAMGVWGTPQAALCAQFWLAATPEADAPVVLPEPDFWVRPAATIHPDRGWQCWSNDGTATGAFHADTVRALLAGVSAPTDPMDWPLPCDVTVGGGTMGKGVKLRTLVLRMKVLYKMATGHDADEVANRTPEQSSALLAKFQARIEGNDTGDLSAQSAQAEPVAWLRTHKLGGVQAFTTEPPPGLKEQCQPLYTAPQAQAAVADARDAARYRWLRKPKPAIGHGSIFVKLDDRAGESRSLSRNIFADELDSACDGAIAAQAAAKGK